MSVKPRLLIYDRESHLEAPAGYALAVGDKFPAIRGNGPRAGQRMGTATVTGFDRGQPLLEVMIGERASRRRRRPQR